MCYMCFLLLIVVVLVGFFFTLLERSVLGYSQGRKGLNSLVYQGIFQGDAVSLFTESMRALVSNYGLYLFSLMEFFISYFFG